MLESDREAHALEAFLVAREGMGFPEEGTVWIQRAVDGAYFSRLKRRFKPWVFQTDRRWAAPFIEQGLDPLAEPGEECDVAVIFATKHREEVLFHLARAAAGLKAGGHLVLTAANDLGAGSLEKRVRELFGTCDAFSKNKCRVLHAVKQGHALDHELLARWRAGGEMRRMAAEGLLGAPGMFSWKRPDEGSRLLAGFIPGGLKAMGRIWALEMVIWREAFWSGIPRSGRSRFLTLKKRRWMRLKATLKPINPRTFVWVFTGQM